MRTGVLAGCRSDTDLGSTPLRTLTVDRGCRGRGEDPASPGHRVGGWFGGRARPGPAAPAAGHLGVLGALDGQTPGQAILVDSWLGAEAPRADALSGGLVPIRGKLAMRAMRPAVAAVQWLRGGVVPQPAPHRGQMAAVPREGTETPTDPRRAVSPVRTAACSLECSSAREPPGRHDREPQAATDVTCQQLGAVPLAVPHPGRPVAAFPRRWYHRPATAGVGRTRSKLSVNPGCIYPSGGFSTPVQKV